MSELEIAERGFGTQAMDFTAAWQLQVALHEQRVADQIGDTAVLLEHPPVYTAGRRTEPHERPVDGTKVIDVDRGGKITFHGPGQLVGYPITKLPSHVLVVDYVRRIEEAVIRAIADLGLTTGRVQGRSGVWLDADDRAPERKVSAIGIRVARGVTLHGFSINCDVDLSWYDCFVPCGIADAGVTSLSKELRREVGVAEVAELLRPHLIELLDWRAYSPSPSIRNTAPIADTGS